MGGTLSNIFKGSNMSPLASGSSTDVPLFGPMKQATPPSAGAQVGMSALKGALDNFSGGQPAAPAGGGGVLGPGPAPTPVDSSYFAPTNFGSPGMSRSAFYGGA